jgi:hypothetical protein
MVGWATPGRRIRLPALGRGEAKFLELLVALLGRANGDGDMSDDVSERVVWIGEGMLGMTRLRPPHLGHRENSSGPEATEGSCERPFLLPRRGWYLYSGYCC